MKTFKLTAILTAALAMSAWADPCGEIAMPTANGTLTYTGDEQSPTIAENDEKYTITGNKQTYAGDYKANVALKDKWVETENETGCKWVGAEIGHETDDLELDWSIAKAGGETNPDYASSKPTGLTATYGDKLSTVSLSSHSGWEWEGTPASIDVGNAGDQTHKAKYTSSNTNYEDVANVDLTVAVGKKTSVEGTGNCEYSKPSGLTATFGDALSGVSLTTGWAWKSGTDKVGNAGDQNHNAVFTPLDTDNCAESEDVALSITVAKATGLTATSPTTVAKPIMVKSTDTPIEVVKNGYLSEIVLNKEDAGTSVYTIGVLTDNSSIFDEKPSIVGNDLKYKANVSVTVDATATQLINIGTDNYVDITATLYFKVTDKEKVTITGLAVEDCVYTPATHCRGVTGDIVASDEESDDYSGQIDSLYIGRDGTTYSSANGTIPPVNAGKYRFTVQVKETVAYYSEQYPYDFEITKAEGATVDEPTLASKTATSITVTAPTAPATGQAVEYAYSSTSTAPASGWQPGTAFTGLTASTTYYVFARSAENENYNAGEASAGVSVTTQSSGSGGGGGIQNGATIAFNASNLTATASSIAVSKVPATGNSQKVEYAISNKATTPDKLSWQEGTTLGPLAANTEYYVYARSKANGEYYRGAAVYATKTTLSSSSGGGSGSGTYYTTTPVLSQAETGNKAIHLANGLSLSVNSGAAVSVYGLKGNLVQSMSFAGGEHTVSLNHLPKGMYIVKVSFRNRENTASHSDMMRVTVK
jgi:hypothetical protein